MPESSGEAPRPSALRALRPHVRGEENRAELRQLVTFFSLADSDIAIDKAQCLELLQCLLYLRGSLAEDAREALNGRELARR